MSDDVSHVHAVYMRQGWYPAKWAHHPEPIKELIHVAGFRPQIKQCWANCQRLVTANLLLGIGLDLELREGWIAAGLWTEHAWLLFEGEVLELTLPPRRDVEYLESYEVPYPELVAALARTGRYGPTDPRRLMEICPYREQLDQLRARQ